jgi:hypothetical protein
LFDWITRQPVKGEWFFEERNGNCRLMASLAERLSETGFLGAGRRAGCPSGSRKRFGILVMEQQGRKENISTWQTISKAALLFGT